MFIYYHMRILMILLNTLQEKGTQNRKSRSFGVGKENGGRKNTELPTERTTTTIICFTTSAISAN